MRLCVCVCAQVRVFARVRLQVWIRARVLGVHTYVRRCVSGVGVCVCAFFRGCTTMLGCRAKTKNINNSLTNKKSQNFSVCKLRTQAFLLVPKPHL